MMRADSDVLAMVLVRSLTATVNNARVAAFAAGAFLRGRIGEACERRLSRQLARSYCSHKRRRGQQKGDVLH